MLGNGIFIADRYEIVGQVGTGGMSDVYKAKDHTLGRYVAIKVLKEEFCKDLTFVTKFRTEAQSAAGLEHPNIVNVYDVGSQDGFYYIVMEYVEGITLKTYIEKKGQLNYKETLSIAIQVGRGIQAAHAKNIIHRDIKPQNIIISTDGKVKVTDFGIARAVSEQTIHSDVMGSVHYASPEQARNGYVSNKSDIYSLGIVMYEMVTGRVPFDGESTVAVAIQHLQDEMVAPSAYANDLPISLEKIILKCTQKNPDRRYESVESLLIDLRKSLISPNEDFVTLVPYSQERTRVISDDELRQIQEKAAKAANRDTDDEDGYAYGGDDEYEDDEDDEEGGRFFNSRMEKIVGIMRIVIAIIIILIVIYFVGSIFGVFKFSFGGFGRNNRNETQISEESKETTTMISLLGRTVEEAQAEVEEMGLTVEQDKTAASTEYAAGQIMEQDIQEGEQVAAGTTVHVTVSSGAEEVDVPDVVGDNDDAALKTLEDAGFRGRREFEYSSDAAAGKVIRQEPKAGTKAAQGSDVVIYVSQGNESVKVPDVVGKTQAEAEDALGNAGLNVSVSTQNSDSVEAGKVISQSVSGGKYVDAGTKITIVVSEGASVAKYRLDATIQAPSNVSVEYADIELLKSESDEVIQSWPGVSQFPFRIQVSDIENVSSGTLSITWYYKDEGGQTQSSPQEQDVNFTRQN